MSDGAAPFVVFSVGDDEFYFILECVEDFEVGPVVFVLFAAAGAFDVHDFDDGVGEVVDGECAAGLDEDAVAFIEEYFGEVDTGILCEGFAAGEEDEGGAVAA